MANPEIASAFQPEIRLSSRPGGIRSCRWARSRARSGASRISSSGTGSAPRWRMFKPVARGVADRLLLQWGQAQRQAVGEAVKAPAGVMGEAADPPRTERPRGEPQRPRPPLLSRLQEPVERHVRRKLRRAAEAAVHRIERA